MGWRGIIRAANAASRQANLQQQRFHRAKGRILDRIERDVQATVDRAAALDAKMRKNLITALKLRYQHGHGFVSEPFSIGKGMINGQLTLTQTTGFKFTPGAYEIGAAKIELLDLMASRWATAIAVRITHSDPAYRIKVNWLKKQDRSNSLIVIIDEENSEFYYPLAEDLPGEVLTGYPVTGIIVFEPFRVPTDRIVARIAGARFTAEKFMPELKFRIDSNELQNDIAENLQKPNLATEIERKLNVELEAAVAAPSKESNSGIGNALYWIVLVALLIVLAVLFAI